MRTLQNHIILYDAECPMCKLYTKAFVAKKMLGKNGRAAYQELDKLNCPMVDRARAVDEIALVNLKTGEVTYGVQSLFKVIGNRFGFLRKLFGFNVVIWLAARLYAFVSYNRRVIAPAAELAHTADFQPAFKPAYRVAYLIFSWLVTATILSAYAPLFADLLPAGGFYREYLICGGQVFFQLLILQFLPARKLWDYLGNMMTISMAGALLLLPVIVAGAFFKINAIAGTVIFLAVAGLMLLEHMRRCRLLGVGFIPTLSWVVYRLLILLTIFLSR